MPKKKMMKTDETSVSGGVKNKGVGRDKNPRFVVKEQLTNDVLGSQSPVIGVRAIGQNEMSDCRSYEGYPDETDSKSIKKE